MDKIWAVGVPVNTTQLKKIRFKNRLSFVTNDHQKATASDFIAARSGSDYDCLSEQVTIKNITMPLGWPNSTRIEKWIYNKRIRIWNLGARR